MTPAILFCLLIGTAAALVNAYRRVNFWRRRGHMPDLLEFTEAALTGFAVGGLGAVALVMCLGAIGKLIGT